MFASEILSISHHSEGIANQISRSTPTMKAGVMDHLWSAEEIIELLDGF
jgi:hypothetical protein